MGGLLKHLAWVEELYFQHHLAGRPAMAPFDVLDLETDWEDWPWHTAADDAPPQDFPVPKAQDPPSARKSAGRDLGNTSLVGSWNP